MKDERGSLGERLGRNVRALREDAGWSQDRLAELLSAELDRDVKGVTVLRMEKGTRPTSVDELAALSAVLGVPAADLIGQEPEQILGVSELKAQVSQMEVGYLNVHRSLERFREQQKDFLAVWEWDAMDALPPGSTVGEVGKANRAHRERKNALSATEIQRGDYLSRVAFEEFDPSERPF